MRFHRARKFASHLSRSADFVGVAAQGGTNFVPARVAISPSRTASTSAASALVEELAALALKLRNGSGRLGNAQRNASRSTSQDPPNLVPLTSRRSATRPGVPLRA